MQIIPKADDEYGLAELTKTVNLTCVVALDKVIQDIRNPNLTHAIRSMHGAIIGARMCRAIISVNSVIEGMEKCSS